MPTLMNELRLLLPIFWTMTLWIVLSSYFKRAQSSLKFQVDTIPLTQVLKFKDNGCVHGNQGIYQLLTQFLMLIIGLVITVIARAQIAHVLLLLLLLLFKDTLTEQRFLLCDQNVPTLINYS